jgi:pyruvate/2-oxoglutarate dehydrogenase complex dihydrolipoamide acyltransferase (E2) component
MPKQKLSPEAAKAKAEGDLAAAKSPKRKLRKAENQRVRRALKKKGFSLKNKDVHHCPKTGRIMLISVAKNRGNFGNGTKKEV